MFRELPTKYKKAQIITHTDLDGYGSGAILVKALTKLGFSIDDIEVTHTDYSNAFPVDEKYNFVLVSDISISNSNDAKKIIEFASKPNNLVLWFDHHKTSIDMYTTYPKLKDIPGIRDTNACGAMLCWMFYQIVCRSLIYSPTTRDILVRLKDINVENVMNSNNPGLLGSRWIFSSTPFGIILTDDYDRFVLKYEDSKYYMEAFNSYYGFERNCKSKYFQEIYISDNTLDTLSYIDKGKKLFLWKRIMELNSIKSNGFIASLPMEGMEDIEMLCINSPNRGSIMFGKCFGNDSFINKEKIIDAFNKVNLGVNIPNRLDDLLILDIISESLLTQYNYCCNYNHDGEKFTVNIYCSEPSKVPVSERQIGKVYDASDICKKCGGGGHPGAAGFITKKLQFCNIKPLPYTLKNQINKEIKELFKAVGEHCM